MGAGGVASCWGGAAGEGGAWGGGWAAGGGWCCGLGVLLGAGRGELRGRTVWGLELGSSKRGAVTVEARSRCKQARSCSLQHPPSSSAACRMPDAPLTSKVWMFLPGHADGPSRWSCPQQCENASHQTGAGSAQQACTRLRPATPAPGEMREWLSGLPVQAGFVFSSLAPRPLDRRSTPSSGPGRW